MSVAAASSPASSREGEGERLIAHLERPLGRGHSPEDGFTGAAGGAACGDLDPHLARARPQQSRRLHQRRRLRRQRLRRHARRRQRRRQPVARRAAARRRAHRRRARSPRSSAGSAPPSATPPSSRPTRCTARWAPPHAPTRTLSASAARTLVAMSGGVDSAVAALLISEHGGEAVGVTLELWSDPQNDGELSCCSAQAVRGARELAHELGMAHLSIDLRAEFRAGVVDGWLSDHAAGSRRTRACAATATCDSTRCSSSPSRLGVGDARHRPLRARRSTRRRRRCCASRSTGRKDQSYVLSALAPGSLARCASRSASMHKHAGARARRARRPARSRASATPRTCASSRARATARSSSVTAGSATRPGADRRSRRASARRARRRPSLHRRPAPRPRHLRARAAVRARDRRCTPTPSRSGRAQQLLAREAERARGARCIATAAASTACACARTGGASRAACAGEPAGRAPRRASRSSWTSPPSAPPRARSRACTPASGRRLRHDPRDARCAARAVRSLA